MLLAATGIVFVILVAFSVPIVFALGAAAVTGLVLGGSSLEMLASSLVVAGLIGLLARWPKLQLLILAVLIALSAGKQFQLANAYRRDWAMQKNLFWQMSWRMPSIAPGTTLTAPRTSNARRSKFWLVMYSRACQRVHKFTRFPTLALPAIAPTLGLMKCGTSREMASLAMMVSASMPTNSSASSICWMP